MKALFVAILSLFTLQSYAQDADVLQQQLQEIITDFPNHFKNLKENDGFTVKLKISGSIGNSFVMGGGDNSYIASSIGNPTDDQDAQDLLSQWSEVINKLTFKGSNFVSSECKNKSEFTAYCKEWHFGSMDFNVGSSYHQFTIGINIINIDGGYAAAVYFGHW